MRARLTMGLLIVVIVMSMVGAVTTAAASTRDDALDTCDPSTSLVIADLKRLAQDNQATARELEKLIAETQQVLELALTQLTAAELEPMGDMPLVVSAAAPPEDKAEAAPLAENPKAASPDGSGATTVHDMMGLQAELAQLQLQTEITTKAADKTSQSVQTLVKNQ